MHESTRLAYLDAMGVISWVPREQTTDSSAASVPPGAQSELVQGPAELSPVVQSSEHIAADVADAKQPEQRVQPAPLATLATPDEAAEQPFSQPEAEARVRSGSPALAPFYLQLWLAGPCALLLEISEPGLEKATAPYRLLTDILRAAGLPDRPVLFADFQWPLTRNPQFDRSAEAASQALTAFVQARLEDQAIVSLGCFGERCALLVDADRSASERLSGREEAVEGLAPAWFCAGLEQLLSAPSEKITLWKLLRRVMPRWKEQE